MGACVLILPKSRAQIKLKSSNPLDEIDFHPNFFDDDQDVADMVRCLHKLRGRHGADVAPPSGIFGVSLHIATYGITEFFQYRGPEVYPGANLVRNLPLYVRRCSNSAYHVYGSTRIGTSRSNSVVDSNLLVHGFHNLRIADAGVIRHLKTGPATTTYMIGERCANFIQKRYGYSYKPSPPSSEEPPRPHGEL